ncbi:hypothetical protein HGRIS_007754 [Hohenbuehelia grisea]|uniref:Uncharacterized protein n=1 Tax=Hohenbuehelia grisea TaxID=104357 RepID=A0ABR3J687_9AGAR
MSTKTQTSARTASGKRRAASVPPLQVQKAGRTILALAPPSRASSPNGLGPLAKTIALKKKEKASSSGTKSTSSKSTAATTTSSKTVNSKGRKRALSNGAGASTSSGVRAPGAPASAVMTAPSTSRGIKRPRLSFEIRRDAKAAKQLAASMKAAQERVSQWTDAQTQTESANLTATGASIAPTAEAFDDDDGVDGDGADEGDDVTRMSEPCEEPFEDLFIDFEMISLQDALVTQPELEPTPWVPVAGRHSVYVPPGVQQLINDMRFLLEGQRKLCERAQEKYLQEFHSRLALQAEVARLKSELALDARRTARHSSRSHR